MTDYLGYVASEYAVDAPATSLHFERWFRNWEAGFEGAAGAPRLAHRAMSHLGLVSGALAGTNYTAFTDLGNVGQLRFDVAVSAAAGVPWLQVSFSSDGGSTWGSDQSLYQFPSGAGAMGCGVINLQTGAAWAIGYATYQATTDSALSYSGTLTVPAGCNAVRFRHSVTRGGRIGIMATGGFV